MKEGYRGAYTTAVVLGFVHRSTEQAGAFNLATHILIFIFHRVSALAGVSSK